jgi:hypothetical protein
LISGLRLVIDLPDLPLRGGGGKKLQIISFVARYPAWQKDSVIFCILQDEPDYALVV